MDKTRILVVEDEILVAESIRERLRSIGYEVPAITSSGVEAIRIVQEIRPDLVLMDIQLEGEIDGVEAAAQIQRLANVPVIYLTAHASETILERVKLTSPYGYILKPFQIRELHSTIEITLSKHKLETKLQESEARYRQLFEGINDAVMVYSHQGRFLDCNRTTLQWLGYSREEFLSLQATDIIHPDFHAVMRSNQKRLRAGEPTVTESVHRRKDGKKISVEINAQPIEYQGEPAILAVVRDITERKQAEEELSQYRYHLEELVKERTAKLTQVNQQLQQEITERKRVEDALRQSRQQYKDLVDSIDGIVWEADAKTTHFIFVSRQAERLLGYSPEKWLTDPTFWLDHIHPDDRDWAVAFCQEATQKKEDHELEYRMIAADGETVWLRDIVTVVVQNNRPDKLRGIMVNISEQKQAEEQIKASLREKEVLLKEIHHRVKNNLQIISSLLYLQAKKIKDEQLLEILKEGQNRIKSMALVHEKLYQSSNLARINFTEYVSNLTAYLFRSYGAGSHQIDRKIAIDKNLQLAISTAIPCGLIINELVSNALKYSFPPKSKQRGEITIEMQAHKESQFCLTISDNGIGLPPGLDFQNTSSLGLQLVNNLVRQLSGTMELEQNGGTSFKIIFPRSEQ